jgi:hypothetical protein
MSQPWVPDAGQAVRLLGFWASPGSDGLPDPAVLVDAGWDEAERQWVADYLERGQVAASYMGGSRCRLCARLNGSRDLTDGAYLWPEGLAHYVLEHAVRLPAEFLAHIERRLERLDELERDGLWCRSNAKLI